MSIFDKVFKAHEDAKAAKVAEERRRAAAAFEKRKDFILTFRSEAARVAKPIFEQFAADARRNGFTARVVDKLSVVKEPTLSVRFHPTRNVQMTKELEEEESVFELRCLADDLKVEHVSMFDQRPKRSGVKHDKLGMPSINALVLEEHLAEFLCDSLKAREPED